MRALQVSHNYLAQFFEACRVVRASLMVSVFAFVVLSLPPQTREVYRVLADDFPNQHWQVALGFIALLVASGFIWHCGRQVTLIERQDALPEPNIEGALLRWLPRLLAALVPLGATLGLYMTIKEAEATAGLVRSVASRRDWPELNDVYQLIDVSPSRLWIATFIAVGLVAVVLLTTIFRTRGKHWKYNEPARWLIGTETTICSSVIAWTCVAMFALAPPSLAQTIGVVAIFGLFLAVLVVVLSNVFVLGDTLGIPLISILVVTAVGLNALDLNDNHGITLVRHARNPAASTELGPAFRQWFSARQDLDYYAKSNEPYPLFIVAAAGGGAYAAHYTATFLARMQDSCPNFAQHVYAISGVSGGSIGASLFAGLAKLKARNQEYVGCNFEPRDHFFEKRTQKFFEQDFLSPVMAAALFPDFVQRFLPFPVGRFDRSRALDASIEAAWNDMAQDAAKEDPAAKAMPNPFESPFLDLWTPERGDEAVPALVLNATEVANGYRIVMSPITTGAVAGKQWSKIARLHPLLPPDADAATEPDIKLSTAVGMSARFPWILPAASVETGADRKRMRLVDGGYVEGSGVDIANQILKALKVEVDRAKDTPDRMNAKFYLVVLMGYEGTPVEDRSFSEAPLPLRTLISTWQTRAEIAFNGAFVEACPEIANCIAEAAKDTSYQRALVELPVIPVFLNLRDFHIPLTWQLTQASREIIALHVGTARRCERNDTLMITWPDEHGPYDRIVKALGENSCSLCTMQFRLAHRSESPEWADERICTRSPPAPVAPATTSAIGK
jgi:predicted acylesterase/phospholipase RssA